jgi:hypothetical protein
MEDLMKQNKPEKKQRKKMCKISEIKKHTSVVKSFVCG